MTLKLRVCEPIRDALGREMTLRDTEGAPLPAEGQPLVGNLLLQALSAFSPPKPADAVAAWKLIQELQTHLDAGTDCEMSERAVGLAREALRQNPLQWKALVLGQLWEVLGTGEE